MVGPPLTHAQADEKMGEMVRAARLIRELRDSGCHDPRETLSGKIRRLQGVQAPDLPAAVRALRFRDPAWPALFAAEERRVRAALGDAVGRTEHFGSSSIASPDLSSKNVIDYIIALSAAPATSEIGIHERLTELGYTPYGNGPCDPETTWWWRIEDGEVAYVAHLSSVANPWIETAVNFRDYLRAHPAECVRYEEVKQRLTAQPGRSLFEYSLGKLQLFYDISSKADAWRAQVDRQGEQPDPAAGP